MEQISQFLEKFINMTAWRMTPPKAYGAFHLIFFIAGLAIVTFVAWKLRNIGERGNRRLLLSVGIFLAVCEVYKQLFYYYYIGNGSYQWWIFPFQLCSVPMYLCIIAPLLKGGKIQRGMYNFMVFFNLMGGFTAFLEPSGLTYEYWTLTLHAFVWHMTLIFIGFYLGFSKRAGREVKDYKTASVTFIALCAVAFCINLIFWRVSGGSINMFFVGPANSSLIVFKDIAKNCGWYVSTVLYIPVVCLGAYLAFLPFYLVERHSKKKREVVTPKNRVAAH